MNPCHPSPDIFTMPAGWPAMTDAERYQRLVTAQRISNAFGPTELPITTRRQWAALRNFQQQALLLAAEMECANRRRHAQSVATGMHGLDGGKELE